MTRNTMRVAVMVIILTVMATSRQQAQAQVQLDFEYSTYNFTCVENSPLNSHIGSVTVRTGDDLTTVQYTLIPQSTNDDKFNIPFSINPNTGLLYTSSVHIDREQYAQYKLNIQAAITTSTGTTTATQYAYTQVVIHIEDVNDNAPQARITTNDRSHTNTTGTFIYLGENLNRNQIIGYINLNDPDNGCNGTVANVQLELVSVKLTDSLIAKYKQINRTVPIVSARGCQSPIRLNRIKDTLYTIQLNSTITFAEANLYELVLNVKDAGQPFQMESHQPLFLVIEPAAQTAPQCEQMTNTIDLTIDETVKPGQLLKQIKCVDFETDIPVQLTLTGSNGFIIKNQNELQLSQQLKPNTYAFAIEAVTTNQVKMTIAVNVRVLDVNDHGPVFNQQTYKIRLNKNELYLKQIAFFSISDDDSFETNSKYYKNEATVKGAGTGDAQFQFMDRVCEQSMRLSIQTYDTNVLDSIKFQIAKQSNGSGSGEAVQCRVDVILTKMLLIVASSLTELSFNLTVEDYGNENGDGGGMAAQFFIQFVNETVELVQAHRTPKNQMNLIDLANNTFRLLRQDVSYDVSNTIDIETANRTGPVCVQQSQSEFKLSKCQANGLNSTIYFLNMQIHDATSGYTYFKQYFLVSDMAVSNVSDSLLRINQFIDSYNLADQDMAGRNGYWLDGDGRGLYMLGIGGNGTAMTTKSSFIQFLIIICFLILSAFLFLLCCICLIIRNYMNYKRSVNGDDHKANDELKCYDSSKQPNDHDKANFKQYVYCLNSNQSQSTPIPPDELASQHDKVCNYINNKTNFEYLQQPQPQLLHQVNNPQVEMKFIAYSSSASTSSSASSTITTDEGCYVGGCTNSSGSQSLDLQTALATATATTTGVQFVNCINGSNFIKNFSRFEQIYNSNLTNQDVLLQNGSYV